MGGSSTGVQRTAGSIRHVGNARCRKHPGGRNRASSWTDNNGNLWLFGGGLSIPTAAAKRSSTIFGMFNPSTNEWAWMGGSSTVVHSIGPARGIRHAGNACRRKRPRWPRMRCKLDRQQRQFLALWGLWLRCQWHLWRSQRPLGVQSIHQAMGLDGRKQHGRAVRCRQPGVYGTLGTPAAGKRPRRPPMRHRVGPTAAAISGSLGALATMPTVAGLSQRPLGVQSIHEAHGRGWAEAARSSALVLASPESTGRWERSRPEISPADVD